MIPTFTHQFFCCILALGVVAATSCKKSSSAKILVNNATMVNEVDPAADGCGWVVRIDGDSTYSPVNLATAYKVDSLKVHVTYQKLSAKYSCGDFVGPNLVSPGITEIQINAISRN
jgi:hypothetical protein